MIVIGEQTIRIADVAAVARSSASVGVGDAVWVRLAAARDLVERWSREDRPAYGLTRGLGPRATQTVPAAERAAFSEMVVRARATGAGGYFERDVVRAALFARVCGLAAGGAGVRPVIVETMMAMLERGVHPLVPRIGSVGTADLVLCANLALPIIGLGHAEFGGVTMPGAEAMASAGIATVPLAEKEGLALCSSNAVSVGMGALVLHDLRDLLNLADATAALTFEAFRGNVSPFDPRVAAARPVPGQVAAAAALRRMLEGSDLFRPGAARRLQDPISLRCVPQVHGALQVGIDVALPHVEVELCSAADNPLILCDDDEILSTGNFHTPGMAIAFDALRLAISQVGSIAASRVSRLMEAGLTDLPEGLSVGGVASVGFGLIRLTAQTLSRELRYLAMPVSTDDYGLMSVEDHVPMTPVAVRKTAEQLDFLRQILACELIVAAQALDLRKPAGVAPIARALFDVVRGAVAPLGEDRSTTEDIEIVSDLIRSGAFVRAIDGAEGRAAF